LIADIGLRPEAEEFVKSTATNDKTKVVFHRTDVTDWSQLEEVFDVAEKTFGMTPDVVCAGAGVYEPVSSSSQMETVSTDPCGG
jgi:NADP-dependent 3-hydroxy acid dehydrogenase YdfG